jgi:hypothetical protein
MEPYHRVQELNDALLEQVREPLAAFLRRNSGRHTQTQTQARAGRVTRTATHPIPRAIPVKLPRTPLHATNLELGRVHFVIHGVVLVMGQTLLVLAHLVDVVLANNEALQTIVSRLHHVQGPAHSTTIREHVQLGGTRVCQRR